MGYLNPHCQKILLAFSSPTSHCPVGLTAVIAMSPPLALGKQRDSAQARLLGSGTSGIAELLVFHPVDTVAKRLMSNKDRTAKVRLGFDEWALTQC
jgi:hypothetical protein